MLLALLLPGTAFAADTVLVDDALPTDTSSGSGFDAHGFRLAAFTDDVRSPLALERPLRFSAWDVYAGGLFEYARQPLVLETVDAETGAMVSREAWLDNVFALNLSAGVAVHDRVRIDLSVPVYLYSSGIAGVAQGADFGDVRASAMVELIRPGADGGVGLGLVPFLDLPTGVAEDFLGQADLAGGGKVTVTGEVGGATLGAEAGVELQPAVSVENIVGSDQALLGAYAGYLLTDSLGLTLEGRAALPLTANEQAGTATPSEVGLSLRKRTEGGAHFVLGTSVALTKGVSAADYRVFFGGGWGDLRKGGAPPASDRDGDTLVDAVDACPDQPESLNGYKDVDGCPDGGSLAIEVKLDGAPVTGADVMLRGPVDERHTTEVAPWIVPVSPASVWTATATDGPCLAGEAHVTAGETVTPLVVDLHPVFAAKVRATVIDTTGNPVPGAKVTWTSATPGCAPAGVVDPDVSAAVGVGALTATARADGYRTSTAEITLAKGDDSRVKIVMETTRVAVTDKGILLLAPVYFDHDAATIKAESFGILDEVAQTLVEHPEILSVEVAGHTDADGPDAYNLALSQRRVDAVRAYLIGKGVAADRLTAKGYGESRPLTTNATEDGKAKNRRVEFTILSRGPSGR